MKKRLSVILAAVMIFSLTACGSSGGSASEETSSGKAAVYQEMMYYYPEDWEYEVNDEGVILTSEDSQAMIILMSVDLSEGGNDYNEDNIGELFDLALSSIISGYDEVKDESEADVTVAGCLAKEQTASISLDDVWYTSDSTAIYDEESQYVYVIVYVAYSDSEGYPDVYQNLLDTIDLHPYLSEEIG